MQLAQTVRHQRQGRELVSYDGGGELLTAILGGQVVAAASGIGEYLDQVEAGAIRVLAVTGEQPLEGVNAPTLTEQGHEGPLRARVALLLVALGAGVLWDAARIGTNLTRHK